MYFELPDCRRCCLCVPLRHGILIFGYVTLLFSLFILGLDIYSYIVYASDEATHTILLYRGVGMYTQIWLAYLFDILEVIFNAILIVGAHKKSTLMMRVYYYYGIVTTVSSFLVFITVRRYEKYQQFPDPLEWALAFSGLGLQCYLLLLIRTELNKLRYEAGSFHYVNHVAEVMVDPGPRRENLEKYTE